MRRNRVMPEKAFHYRKSPKAPMLTGEKIPRIYKQQEVLVGEIKGKQVPVTEERWYKAVMKTKRARWYGVQYEIGVKGLPGYRTLDALVLTDLGWRGFEVDGTEYVHRGERKRAMDKLADYQRITGLERQGIYLRRGIEHILDTRLQTQLDADRLAEDTL